MSIDNHYIQILNDNIKKNEDTFKKQFLDAYNDIIDKTSFLNNEDNNWKMRKYCYKNNIKEYPKCVVCGKDCKINRKTCSEECTKKYCKSEKCIKLKINKSLENHGINCFKKKPSKLDILKNKNINLYNDIMNKTNWLNDDTSYSERMYCYKNNIKEYPKCVVCGKNTKFIQGYGYTKTCSKDCFNIFNSQIKNNFSNEKKLEIKNKIKNTKNNFSNEKKLEIKNKIKNTCLEKYNSISPVGNDIIKNKIKNTCLEKYGVDNIFKNKEYIKNKIYEKYGVDNIFKNKEYIKNKIYEKYGVDNVTYIGKNPEVIDILNSKEKFIHTIEHNDLKSVPDIMKFLDVSDYCVLMHLKKYNINGIINRNISSYEDDITRWLNKNNIHTLNNQRILDKKEVDIYLPDYNIGIEFNGNYWHSDIYKDSNYHQNKSLMANEKNIFIYHIFEYEWKIKKEKILNHLSNILLLNKNKIYARKCVIKEVDSITKNNFLEDNHLQGKDHSTIKLGLYFNNELVEIMTFCKPRFNKKYEYELSRLCTLHNCNVIGGANKLFKYFINNYNPKSIISYSDYSKNKGNIYNVLGFNKLKLSKPNYVWINNEIVLSRYQTQKSKLLKMGLKGNTEDIIMRSQHFYKLYDCGNFVYEWLRK